MKIFVMIVMAVMVMGAGPTTKLSLPQLILDLELEKKSAIDKCHQTNEFKVAFAEREKKRVELDAARATDIPAQDRMTVSSAFGKAERVCKQMETTAILDDQKIQILEQAIKTAEAEAERGRQEQAEAKAAQDRFTEDAKAKDPIQVAIRDGQIVKGMTVEQAHQAFETSVAKSYYGHFGVRNVTDNSELEDGTRIIRWRCLVPTENAPFLARSVTVKSRDGKVVSIEDVNNNP